MILIPVIIKTHVFDMYTVVTHFYVHVCIYIYLCVYMYVCIYMCVYVYQKKLQKISQNVKKLFMNNKTTGDFRKPIPYPSSDWGS